MRVLMITPYPPARDGIAVYAVQAVKRLRARGDTVEVLSPRPSAAQHHVDLRSWRALLAIPQRMRGFDRVIVQFHPDIFFAPSSTPLQRARTAAAVAVAWRSAPGLEVRVHEADYSGARRPGITSLAMRLMWQTARSVSVHTEAERRDFHRAFGVPLRRIRVAAHGEDFLPRTTATREAARESLGIAAGDLMFLSIGFIQHHKGFDRTVRAFARLGPAAGGGARLDVVGSVRVEDPGQLEYAAMLRRLVEETPGAHLHSGFVSDEAFDRWIVAADVVVLPYVYIWSSGVLERAALYGKPVIATRVGGLADQARPGMVLVDDDDQLAQAMRRYAEERGLYDGAPAAAPLPWPVEPLERTRLQDAIRARAAAARATRGRLPSSPGQRAHVAATAPLRRLGRFALPPPVSSRAGATPVKRIVQRLTAWQLVPVVERLNALQQAVIDAVEQHDAPPAAPRDGAGEDATPRSPAP